MLAYTLNKSANADLQLHSSSHHALSEALQVVRKQTEVCHHAPAVD